MAVKFDNDVMKVLFPATWGKPVQKRTAENPQFKLQAENGDQAKCDTSIQVSKMDSLPPEAVPVKEEPETETFSLQELEQTIYHSPHTVKLSANQAILEIIEKIEPVPEGEHPCDFDEMIEFMDKHGITAKATHGGLVITGGTQEQRQRVIACLNSSIWIYGNLRLYLDGKLLDIDGQKYQYPIKR